MVAVLTHALVDCDIEEGIDYYRSTASDAVAEEFFRSYRTAFGRLESNPYQYGEEADGFRHAPLRDFPYSILYVIFPQYAWVYTVAHHSRRPNTFSRRGPRN